MDVLKSQIVTSSWGGTRKLPYAFTEPGIAQLSSVLHSERAIETSVKIMSAFVAMRHFIIQNAGVLMRITNLDTKINGSFHFYYLEDGQNWTKMYQKELLNIAFFNFYQIFSTET